MTTEFNDSFISGIDEIDRQHKDIFNAASMLSDPNNDLDKIWIIFNQIEKYVTVHFETEEKYMKDHAYLYMSEHIEEHEKFFKNYRKLKCQLEQNGLLMKFISDVKDLINEWLTTHYNDADIILINHIKQTSNIKCNKKDFA